MYIAVILENFSQAQEDVQQVNKHTVKKKIPMIIFLGFNR